MNDGCYCQDSAKTVRVVTDHGTVCCTKENSVKLVNCVGESIKSGKTEIESMKSCVNSFGCVRC